MKSTYIVTVNHRAMNELSFYQEVRDILFAWHRNHAGFIQSIDVKAFKEDRARTVRTKHPAQQRKGKAVKSCCNCAKDKKCGGRGLQLVFNCSGWVPVSLVPRAVV